MFYLVQQNYKLSPFKAQASLISQIRQSDQLSKSQKNKKKSMHNHTHTRDKDENSYYSSNSSLIFNSQQNIHPIYMSREFNTGSVTIWVSEDLFYIEAKYVNTFIPTVMKIWRNCQRIQELTPEDFRIDKINEEQKRRELKLENQQKFMKMQPMHFSFFIGIVNLSEISKNDKKQQKKCKKTLILAETVQLVCTINLRNIYKILKPVYLFYNPKDKQSLNEEEALFLLNLTLLFQKGMYYSYTYNLAQPLKDQERDIQIDLVKYNKDQRKSVQRMTVNLKDSKRSDPGEQKSSKLIKFPSQNYEASNIPKDHSQFNWAAVLQQQFSLLHQKWRMPVIQGFVSKIQVYVNAQKLKIVLISRRSKRNGGPLQYATGFTKYSQEPKCQETKNVANYVETEFIFHIKNIYFSFMQVRGTVPLHWQYKYNYGIASGVSFHQTIEENYKDFERHIISIKESHNFKSVTLLNLLQKHSPNIETKLIQNLEYVVKKFQRNPSLHYVYFDMHERCANKKYGQFNKFLNKQLGSILQQCGFSVFQRSSSTCLQKIQRQAGIIRTNCGTCIDRTNNVQSRIAAWQLVQMLRSLNVKITNLDQSLEFIENDSPFARLYRTMWADNADAISEQYSGTLSVQSTAVRMGRISYFASIDHGLTSLYRMVRNLREEDNGKMKIMAYLSMDEPKRTNKKQLQPLTSQNSYSNQELA